MGDALRDGWIRGRLDGDYHGTTSAGTADRSFDLRLVRAVVHDATPISGPPTPGARPVREARVDRAWLAVDGRLVPVTLFDVEVHGWTRQASVERPEGDVVGRMEGVLYARLVPPEPRGSVTEAVPALAAPSEARELPPWGPWWLLPHAAVFGVLWWACGPGLAGLWLCTVLGARWVQRGRSATADWNLDLVPVLGVTVVATHLAILGLVLEHQGAAPCDPRSWPTVALLLAPLLFAAWIPLALPRRASAIVWTVGLLCWCLAPDGGPCLVAERTELDPGRSLSTSSRVESVHLALEGIAVRAIDLAGLGAADLVTALLIALGIAVWLGVALRSALLGAGSFVFAAGILANAQRLALAGGGCRWDATDREVHTWRPPWLPIVGIVGLAMISSQSLIVRMADPDRSTDTARRALVEIRRQITTESFHARDAALTERMAAIDGDGFLAERQREALRDEQTVLAERLDRALTVDLAAYELRLRESPLLAARWRRVWREPIRAGLGTLVVMGILCVGPLARWPARDVVRRYQLLRVRRDRASVERDLAVTRALLGDPSDAPLRPGRDDPRLLALTVEQALERLGEASSP